MKLSIHLTLLLLMAATTRKAPGQDLTSITRQMSAFYEGIQSVTTTTKSRSNWLEDFIRYRQTSGHPVGSRLTGFSESTYTAKGSLFSADVKGSNSALNDTRYAWDGTHWQSLNRLPSTGPILQITRKRSGGLEASGHRASIFEMALPFLIEATPRKLPEGIWPEDDHSFRVTLDKAQDSLRWEGVARRLVGKVEPVTLAGQACLKFRIDGGVARGDRATKIFYDIWVPADHPIFPVKHETRSQATDILMGRFEVMEVFDRISIAGRQVTGFPKRYRLTFFTDDLAWLNKPYMIDEFELSRCEFNMAVSDNEFKIDPSQAKIVELVDTQQTIYNDKAGQ